MSTGWISPEIITALSEQKKANPFLSFAKQAIPYLPEALTVGSLLVDTFSGKSEYEKVMDQAFENIIADQNRYARQSKGQFTPREIREIREAGKHRVNRVAGNVAQRGLGGSGVGLQQITEAQQRPFMEAQATATRMLPALNQQIFNLGQVMMGDDSFHEDLGGLIQGLRELRGLKKLRRERQGQAGDAEDEMGNDFDGVIGNALTQLVEFIKGIDDGGDDGGGDSVSSTEK